ncbi:MAG: cupin domain-containing protein [Rhizobiales bacterium]|nr:cupin domain-containing protein [Hyphomicrobiales bacterium]
MSAGITFHAAPGSATARVLVDNERTTVTEWRFRPGENTGWHRHERDYVVVPMLDGRVRLAEPGGIERVVAMKAGEPYYRAAGVEHDVINAGDADYVFIEVEFK